MKKVILSLVIGAVVGLSVGYTVAQVQSPSSHTLQCTPLVHC